MFPNFNATIKMKQVPSATNKILFRNEKYKFSAQ